MAKRKAIPRSERRKKSYKTNLVHNIDNFAKLFWPDRPNMGLSEALGVHWCSVHDYRHGYTVPSADILLRMADIAQAKIQPMINEFRTEAEKPRPKRGRPSNLLSHHRKTLAGKHLAVDL